jgi:hypothetical protein
MRSYLSAGMKVAEDSSPIQLVARALRYQQQWNLSKRYKEAGIPVIELDQAMKHLLPHRKSDIYSTSFGAMLPLNDTAEKRGLAKVGFSNSHHYDQLHKLDYIDNL